MIGELGPEDIDQLLRAETIGHLGCHARGRTYVVPVTYAYDGASIFAYTGNGLKVRMMRENPAVCVEVEQLSQLPSWRTAIAFGRFEELSGGDAAAALRFLRERLREHGGRPLRAIGTWVPGVEAAAPRQSILYAVRITEATGRYELAPEATARVPGPSSRPSPGPKSSAVHCKLSGMRTVVTGANRGIGLELVRQLRDRGDEVEACARRPGEAHVLAGLAGARVRIHPLDVTDPASVRALASSLGDAPIDVVFNIAGVYGDPRRTLDQLAEDLAMEEIATTFDVNAIGALRVAVALLPNVRRGTAKKLVHIGSNLGSISANTRGGQYAYRMSKAALNMMSRSLAADLRGEGITSIVINPGWVQTDMGGPDAPTPVAEAVQAILRETDRATLAESGEFLHGKGDRYPW